MSSFDDEDEILPTISGKNVIMAFGGGPSPSYVQRNPTPTNRLCTILFWSRYSLFAVNCIIWAAGMTMLGFGAWALVNGADIDIFKSLLIIPCTMLMVTGGLMVTVGTIGWVGALRLNIVNLRVFMVMCIAVFGLQLAVGAMLFFVVDHLELDMHRILTNVVKDYQTGADKDADEVLDKLQEKLMCCGAKGYSDWEENIYYNCTSKARSKCGVPTSCCKGVKDEGCGNNVRDGTDKYISTLVYNEGCTVSLIRIIREHTTTTATIAFAISFLDIFAIILASLVIKYTRFQRTLLSRSQSQSTQ